MSAGDWVRAFLAALAGVAAWNLIKIAAWHWWRKRGGRR